MWTRASSRLWGTGQGVAGHDPGERQGALTLFPTQALAQESEMSLEEYEEFVFEAMALNEDDPVRYWRRRLRSRGD